MIRGNTIDFIGHPLHKDSISAHGTSHHALAPPFKIRRWFHAYFDLQLAFSHKRRFISFSSDDATNVTLPIVCKNTKLKNN